jgi:hypothetical protein
VHVHLEELFLLEKNGETPEFLPWKNDETWEISGRYPISNSGMVCHEVVGGRV